LTARVATRLALAQAATRLALSVVFRRVAPGRGINDLEGEHGQRVRDPELVAVAERRTVTAEWQVKLWGASIAVAADAVAILRWSPDR
jgi:hypothetical protein